jgi:thiol-disulfide isomerase/thioredoxin
MMRRQLVRSGLLLPGALTTGTLSLIRGRAQPVPAGPKFIGIDGWINSAPISVEQFQGTVVLVNFWTYSCINSRRPMVYLKRWNAQYASAGLRIVGIHTPEFAFEHDLPNVDAYVRQEEIRFPVGLDNNYATWNAFGNDAWPGFYMMDRAGDIVLSREGEGYGHEMENAIRDALGLPASEVTDNSEDDPDLSKIASPEMYFGAQHPTPQDLRQSPRLGTASYSFAHADDPALNVYTLDGTWSREDERLVLISSQGGLHFRFSSAKLYMVASAPRTGTIRVQVDGHELPPVAISWPTLYTIVDGSSYGEHMLKLEVDTPGLTLFSTTFG